MHKNSIRCVQSDGRCRCDCRDVIRHYKSSKSWNRPESGCDWQGNWDVFIWKSIPGDQVSKASDAGSVESIVKVWNIVWVDHGVMDHVKGSGGDILYFHEVVKKFLQLYGVVSCHHCRIKRLTMSHCRYGKWCSHSTGWSSRQITGGLGGIERFGVWVERSGLWEAYRQQTYYRQDSESQSALHP